MFCNDYDDNVNISVCGSSFDTVCDYGEDDGDGDGDDGDGDEDDDDFDDDDDDDDDNVLITTKPSQMVKGRAKKCCMWVKF